MLSLVHFSLQLFGHLDHVKLYWINTFEILCSYSAQYDHISLMNCSPAVIENRFTRYQNKSFRKLKLFSSIYVQMFRLVWLFCFASVGVIGNPAIFLVDLYKYVTYC